MSERLAEREPTGLRTFPLGSVALREEDAGDGRTLTGYAYRWGDLTAVGGTAEFPDAAEGFQRGAFARAIAERAGRPFPFLDRHRGNVVAGITFAEDDIGLRFDGRLLDTPAADAYRATVPVADGVSLEILIGEVRRQGRTVMHTAVRRIAGLAGVYAGAYQSASVALRDQSGGIDTVNTCETCGAELVPGVAHICNQAPAISAIAERSGIPGVVAGPVSNVDMTAFRELAREAAEEVYRIQVERGGAASGADPFAAFRDHGSLGEMFLSAATRDASVETRSYVARAIAARALADTVTTAGANAGLLEGALSVQEIAGIVSRGRPAITAFGGPRPVGEGTGMNVTWPYFDGTLTDYVAAQSAEKAEIESAVVNVKLGTEALVTYAGGGDIAYQLIRRGNPSILDAFARIILTAWGVVTDAAFVTELESGSATKDLAEAITAVDYAELVGHVIDSSVTVETATGAPAEFVLASSTAFAAYAKLIAAASSQIQMGGGSLDLRGLNLTIGNLPLIHAPSITAGKAIISNRLAAGWHEEGPFQASGEDVAKLGRNVAYWSMGAGARYIAAGIIELYDVTP